MARHQAAEDPRLASGPDKGSALAFDVADLVGQRHTAHQEIVNRNVDLVYFAAQIVQRRSVGSHGIYGVWLARAKD